LLGTPTKAAIAAASAGLAIAVLASVPAGASTGGTGAGRHDHKGYVNPFKPGRWYAGRIDMGVDYVPRRRQRVVAIGDAKILGSTNRSGWPGGHFIWYKLLDGDHAGAVIYVAEELRRLAPKGAKVAAGDRIATALPGGSGLETGWANRRGEARAAPCYSEGMKTHSGREMGRFLHSLGAKVGDRPGRVPDHPAGKRC
jgi:murein DD-endopeptidase MepM/ murein hydrolase activator NlpD